MVQSNDRRPISDHYDFADCDKNAQSISQHQKGQSTAKSSSHYPIAVSQSAAGSAAEGNSKQNRQSHRRSANRRSNVQAASLVRQLQNGAFQTWHGLRPELRPKPVPRYFADSSGVIRFSFSNAWLFCL
jgi:hypothetical protein